jgi:hypothetical protein
MAGALTVTGRLALAAALLAGCGSGGGDDGAKVEAGLRQYIASALPEQTPFPVGAGPPRVKDHSCRDRHLQFKNGQELMSRTAGVILADGTAVWSCVVEQRTLALPVVVGVKDGTEIVFVMPGRFEQFTLK